MQISNEKTDCILLRMGSIDTATEVGYAVVHITPRLIAHVKRAQQILQKGEWLEISYDDCVFCCDDLSESFPEIASTLVLSSQFVTDFPSHPGAEYLDASVITAICDDDSIYFECRTEFDGAYSSDCIYFFDKLSHFL